MGSTRFTVTGYSSRPSWLKPWSEIARKWMRRKRWHGVYYFNLVFCSSHKLAGADFCQILHFCKSTIFSVQNGYRLVWITSFPKLLTNPYSLSNYFMIMIDENFFARLVLKISISKFFEISKNMKIHVLLMMLVVNWMQQIILEPFSFIYIFHKSLGILLNIVFPWRSLNILNVQKFGRDIPKTVECGYIDDRCWWRMLEIKCIGDKIWMLVTSHV